MGSGFIELNEINYSIYLVITVDLYCMAVSYSFTFAFILP